ncbi:DUF551 domain-containing protein [Escherichia coli]|uniref:DUF551 domain-containing protein n=1 Tax=Escherichia coli TaxID=562 RepID=UPI00128ECD75|nr:DUF551 domain-containing protein [Escherichia coli]MBM2952847.1 DUF551 domain-containing protein [Escherichia coli]MQL42042.1 DUF551 domain-containing protein [Escherichia coli]
MTTTTHPAHGPVSLDRLHQISEILSKAAAQSDGGNLGYAMADAVKVIDGVIAVFDAEPVAWRYRYVHTPKTEEHGYPFTTEWKLCDSEDECNPSDCFERQPLYTAQPAPVSIPGELTREEYKRRFMAEDNFDDTFRGGWNACRAAMLQAGNSPVTPDDWIPVSERMPEAHDPVYIFHPDYGVDQCVWYDDQEDEFLWDSDNSRCRAIETVSHWMPMPSLPAAPQQEVK